MTDFVLFDLDNTLVDSLHLKPLRDARRWPDVYKQIETIELFTGVKDVWDALSESRVYLGVVTHSPKPYAQKVLAHVGLTVAGLVCYHDLDGKKKPSPFGYKKCCSDREANRGAAVGDERSDLLAADSFGCRGVFAGWSKNPILTEADCRQAGWAFARTPNEMLKLLKAINP